MGIYLSRGFYKYEISKDVYNYLLPIYGRTAKYNGFKFDCFIVEEYGKYFFIGTHFDYKDMLKRIVCI